MVALNGALKRAEAPAPSAYPEANDVASPASTSTATDDGRAVMSLVFVTPVTRTRHTTCFVRSGTAGGWGGGKGGVDGSCTQAVFRGYGADPLEPCCRRAAPFNKLLRSSLSPLIAAPYSVIGSAGSNATSIGRPKPDAPRNTPPVPLSSWLARTASSGLRTHTGDRPAASVQPARVWISPVGSSQATRPEVSANARRPAGSTSPWM